MEHRAIQENMERMDRMDKILEEPLSENDSIADEPLYGIPVASTGKDTLQAESAASAKETGRESQAGPINTDLKHRASSQKISYVNRSSINHNGSTLSVSASATPATTVNPRGSVMQSQPPPSHNSIEDYLEVDLDSYYQVDRALEMIHKNAPHARAKRATPGIPGYELFFDLTEDLEEQFKAASKGLVAQGIPIDSPAGFDLWKRLDRIQYGVSAKKDVEVPKQAVRSTKKSVSWADARVSSIISMHTSRPGNMHTPRVGDMRTAGPQQTNIHASAATIGSVAAEVLPVTTDGSATKVSRFYEMVHAASNEYAALESAEIATSDADGEWEEDTEMLSAAQSHVQQ